MQIIELPDNGPGLTHHLIDWHPAVSTGPNDELLKQMQKPRRSRTGKLQSEHSKRRQNFMIDMDRYTGSREELRLRATYIEEWHIRMSENEH